MYTKLILPVLAGTLGVFACSQGVAATFQWAKPEAGSFLDAANWTNTAAPYENGVPVDGDTAVNNYLGSTTTISAGESVSVGTFQPNAGAFSMVDGALYTLNLQLLGAGGITQSGGYINTTADSRIAANGVWSISGGTFSLSKMVVGSTSAATNAQLIVSGNATIYQNQIGSTRELWVGGNNGGSGSLLLKDFATWANDSTSTRRVVIGNNGVGKGTLTLQDNASFSYSGIVILGDTAGNTGTLNLNGGVLSATGVNRGAGTGVVNFNGGRVAALAPSTSFFGNFAGTGENNSINLFAGGMQFDTGEQSVGITNVLSGGGGLTKLGSGVLTLSASNTFTGATVINGGTLVLAPKGSLGSSSITLNSSVLDLRQSSAAVLTTGGLTFNDSTIIAGFSATNLLVGTLGAGGSINVIEITSLPNVTSLPARVPLIKYSTAAPGLVNNANVLTSLSAILPALGSPSGYLTNNAATKTIELVITGMILTPEITRQPQPDSAYLGYAAHFGVELAITNSPTYQWRKNGMPLANGPGISGADSAVLRFNNVSLTDAGEYDVVVTSPGGSVTSLKVPLTIRAASGYEAAALTLKPCALYLLNEEIDPSLGNVAAYDYAGDFDGVYGIAVQNGNPFHAVSGPGVFDGFAGFGEANGAARFQSSNPDARITLPPLNLNTNTVTLTAWINPGNPVANAGLIFCRGQGTVAGLNFSSSLDANGYRTLGYTWNNEVATYTWNSRLAPLPGQWSFVALVVSPTNATIYIFDANGLRAASHNYTHVVQSFSASAAIGDDMLSSGNRQFDGVMDSVGIYAQALTQAQLESLFFAASGVAQFQPVLWAQPTSLVLYEKQTATFTAGVSGSLPLRFQWQKTDGVNYVNIVNGGRISGANSATLVITEVASTDMGNYVLRVENDYGLVITDIASLTVNPSSPAQAITNSVLLTSGQDWNTDSIWSDNLSAFLSAASKPGSTYHVVAGGGLRTPNITSSTNFPGEVLTIYGDGKFNAGNVTSAGGLIIKAQAPGSIYYKRLVMNGGQIFSFTDNNNPTILSGGELEIVSNTPIAGLSSTGGRSFTINSRLSGSGSIEYVGWPNATFQPSAVTALNIAGTNNTFKGTWNIVSGTLVGSTPGALGTNIITVGSAGALQAAYDLNNPQASLVLNGRFNLTHNHTFKTVVVNGVTLGAGTYTHAQLAAAYPAHFPATWTGQTGVESATSAQGSITVLSGASTPVTLASSWNGSALTLTWPSGWILLEATSPAGPWAANNAATSPFVVTPAQGQKFFRLQAQ